MAKRNKMTITPLRAYYNPELESKSLQDQVRQAVDSDPRVPGIRSAISFIYRFRVPTGLVLKPNGEVITTYDEKTTIALQQYEQELTRIYEYYTRVLTPQVIAVVSPQDSMMCTCRTCLYCDDPDSEEHCESCLNFDKWVSK